MLGGAGGQADLRLIDHRLERLPGLSRGVAAGGDLQGAIYVRALVREVDRHRHPLLGLDEARITDFDDDRDRIRGRLADRRGGEKTQRRSHQRGGGARGGGGGGGGGGSAL